MNVHMGNLGWYHVWCNYRDRIHDRIRDCFIAPVIYEPDGSMRDDLDLIDDKETANKPVADDA